MTWIKPSLALLAAPLLALSSAQIAFAEELLIESEVVTLDEDESYEKLVFLGGLEIKPGDDGREGISGISGLEWSVNTLYAVTDNGYWMTIAIDEMNARLVDAFEVERGRLTNLRDRRLSGDDRDAEAITQTSGGDWLISFEGNDRIWRYAGLDGPAVETSFDLGPIFDVARASDNSGFETLEATSDGLIACGEWAAATVPNCVRITSEGTQSFELQIPEALVEHGGAPTDASCLDNGTCYVLTRSWRANDGNRIAIIELSPDNQSSTLATFAKPLVVDNFEGLAVRERNGQTELYLVSDDNERNCDYNRADDCQRTLLYKFAIRSEEPVRVAAPPPGSVPVSGPSDEFETVSVVLETALGDITVALEVERAPITAANFLRYVDEDRFDGTVFYRAMKLQREPLPNGLIQGGTQFDPKRILPGIAHEPTNVTGLSHTSGALSMAMLEPGTANGDFSIMVRDQIGLDAQPESEDPIWRNGYAVFGYVIDGMDVVEAIHGSPADPNKGEGVMQGQILADPVEIIDARRLAPAQSDRPEPPLTDDQPAVQP